MYLAFMVGLFNSVTKKKSYVGKIKGRGLYAYVACHMNIRSTVTRYYCLRISSRVPLSLIVSVVQWRCKKHRCKGLEMAMSCTRLKYMISKEAIGMGSCRTFAAGDALKASTLSKEVKSTTVVGSNIVKDGTDSKIMPESEYPDWLWHLLDKQPALSELRKKNVETLPYEKLERFVKLDNRARIKDSNSVRAKN
ncbi:uncharacterized protein LOC122076860 isoform X1 [Macadamia integrifolia]|uniref:uncharacterized protein LOC122076860 isoform X1 n=1 Tax=Macadamia integrifolia TaxID=60698 RepID=UPI001C4EF973|nr:uncharacterized protein LOC122076860 isoform X1 [Macadamia integrifolia]